MSYLSYIPSQQEAVRYLSEATEAFNTPLRIGGHSKGGNLAVYAAAFCHESVQERILAVYNNDGPGFRTDLLSTPAYHRIRDRVHTFIPQSSVVGMLFDHEEDYFIVKSQQVGLFQHDLYSWCISYTHLEKLESVTRGSRFINHTLKEWVTSMDLQKREQFVDALYEVLMATRVTSWKEFATDWSKHTGHAMSYLRSTDAETRQLLFNTLGALFQSARHNLFSEKQK